MLPLLVFQLACLATVAIIPTAAAVGLYTLNRRWRLHLAELEMQQLSTVAREAVVAAEQRYKDAAKSTATNQQKLDYATHYVLANLMRAGIAMDRQTANGVIEAHLYHVRNPEDIPAEMPPIAYQEEVLPRGQRPLAWT